MWPATPLDPTRGTTAMGVLGALAGRARSGSAPQRLVLWGLFWPLLLALRCQPRSGARSMSTTASTLKRHTRWLPRSGSGLAKILSGLSSDGAPLPANPDWEAHGKQDR